MAQLEWCAGEALPWVRNCLCMITSLQLQGQASLTVNDLHCMCATEQLLARLAMLPPCRLAAQLARTEEAAKRALVKSDQGARGSTAQQLLDAQRTIQQLQAENSELSSKLAR